LFAEGAITWDIDVYVANPPWLPGVTRTPIERAIFDPKSEILERYLAGLSQRLGETAEGWLILSDLAERLGLRTNDEVEERARRHGLLLRWTRSCQSSTSPRAGSDPISIARSEELVILRCFARG
jgi:hypothetical protein